MSMNNGGKGNHECYHKDHTKKKKLTKKELKALNHLKLFQNKRNHSQAQLEIEIQNLNRKNAA